MSKSSPFRKRLPILIRQRRQAVLAHMVKELCRVEESFPRYQHIQVVRRDAPYEC